MSKNAKNTSNILREWFKLTNHPLPQHMENAIEGYLWMVS